MQRRALNENEPSEVPPIVREVLRSSGQPLDPATRAFFEPRFGHDFSQVRVHTDARAAESAHAVNALAYTVGRHVAFETGQYSPGTAWGSQLLAHELTHVVQQGASSGPVRPLADVGHSPNVYEAEADSVASRVAGGNLKPQPVRLREVTPAVRRLAALRSECTDLMGPCPANSQDYRDSQEAVRRMNATTAGQWLIRALQANQNLQSSTIVMRFASNIVRREAGVQGSFDPDVVGASAYSAYVDLPAHQATGTARTQPAESPLPRPVSTYGGGGVVIPSYVVERPSMLAETLFHELLHIWYLNTYSELGLAHPDHPRWGTEPFTGHVRAERGEIEAPFAQRLRQFAVQIYRAETAPRPVPAPPPAPARPTAPPAVTPQPPAVRPRAEAPAGGASRWSFVAGVDAAATWLPPSNMTDLGLDFHAGFLYGHATRFGAWGNVLYLPRQGLVGLGGGVELRVLQTEDQLGGGTRIAHNPLFFDLNAGAAYVLRSADPALFSLGAGVGQEYGEPGGWAPFWQVGGALLARPTAAMSRFGGEVGLTVGVRR